MKRLMFLWLAIHTVTGHVFLYAQSSHLSLPKAIFAYYRYGGHPDRIQYLEQAREAADRLMLSSAYQTSYELWQLRGDVYSAYVSIYRKKPVEVQLQQWRNAHRAARAYLRAYQLAYRAIEKEELQEKMYRLGHDLYYLAGLALYHEKAEAAYQLGHHALALHQLLRKEGKTSFLPSNEETNLTFLIASAAVMLDKTAEAVPLLEKLYRQAYPDPFVYTTLAHYYMAYDLDRATEVLKKGRELFPYHPDILKSIAQLYMSAGQYELAEEVLHAMLQSSDDPEVMMALAEVYIQHFEATGDKNFYDKAYRWLRNILDRVPQHYAARRELAHLHALYAHVLSNSDPASARRHRRLALTQCQQLEQENPNDPEVLKMLHRLYQTEGNQTLANEFLRRWDTVRQGGVLKKSFFTHR